MANKSYTNTIIEQVFEIEYGDKSKATALQNRFSDLQRMQLQSILDKVLDGYDEPLNMLKIDRLEVDLGDIPLDRLEAELPTRLEEALHKVLYKIKVGEDYLRTTDLIYTRLPIVQSDIAVLETFLASGAARVNATDDKKAKISRLIIDLEQKEPQQLIELLRKLERNQPALQRFIGEASATVIERVLERLKPGVKKQLAKITEIWLRQYRAQAVLRGNDTTFRQQVRRVALEYLLRFRQANNINLTDLEDFIAGRLTRQYQIVFTAFDTSKVDKVFAKATASYTPTTVMAYYLHYGYLPVSAKQLGISNLEAYFVVLLNSGKKAVLDMLQAVLREPLARQRALAQFSAATIDRILQLLDSEIPVVTAWAITAIQNIARRATLPLDNVAIERTVKSAALYFASRKAATVISKEEDFIDWLLSEVELYAPAIEDVLLQPNIVEVLPKGNQRFTRSFANVIQRKADDKQMRQTENEQEGQKEQTADKAEPADKEKPKPRKPTKLLPMAGEEEEPDEDTIYNNLQALVFLLTYGVLPANMENPQLLGGDDVLQVLVTDLLEAKPAETLATLFTLLENELVRERLARLLPSELMARLLAQYAEVHQPVAALSLFMEDVELLLSNYIAINQEWPTQQRLVDVLRTFVLGVLYDEQYAEPAEGLLREWVMAVAMVSGLGYGAIAEALIPLTQGKVFTFALRDTLQKLVAQSAAVEQSREAERLAREQQELLMEQLRRGEGPMIERQEPAVEESPIDETAKPDTEPPLPEAQQEAEKPMQPPAETVEATPDMVDDSNVLPEAPPVAPLSKEEREELLREKLYRSMDEALKGSKGKQKEEDTEAEKESTDTQLPIEEEQAAPPAEELPIPEPEQKSRATEQSTELPTAGTSEPPNQDEMPIAEEPQLAVEQQNEDIINQPPLPPADEVVKKLREKLGLPKKRPRPIGRQQHEPSEYKPYRVSASVPEEPIYIENAGLVLLTPFIPFLFRALGYMEDGVFKDQETAYRGVHLLQYLVTGEEQPPEYLLPLNKILCGVPLTDAIEKDIILTQREKDETEVMMRSVVSNWDKIKHLSPAVMRDSFLKREGRLLEETDRWSLKVKVEAYDILLDSLPWSYTMVKMKWMDKILYTEWK